MATLEEEVRNRNRQGIMMAQQGRLDDAAAWFRAAIDLSPSLPAGHNNLGNILSFQGRLDEAVASYRKALALLPNDPATLNNLGNSLRQLGELDESFRCCRQAVDLQPDYCEAHSNLGLVLEAKGRLDEALYHSQVAIHLRPDFADAHSNLSMVLRGLGRIDEAIAACHEALRLRPNYAEAYNNLGYILLQQERWNEASECFRKAVEIKPELVEARVSLASCYWWQDRLDDASALCEEALKQRPKLGTAHNILGAVLLKQGRLDESLARFDESIRLDPNLAEAHFNRAMVLLSQGDLENGWREYEWRWKCKNFVIRAAERQYWDGSSLAGKTILLCAEQGLGDTLQFIRYAPMVKRGGAHVIMACAEPLIPLLRRCAGIDELVARDGNLPECDTHSPLLNLPSLFKTKLETVPNDIPYLFADEKLIHFWRDELKAFPGFKIAIAWKGNSKHPFDRYRSIPLSHYSSLALPGVHLLSLQKGAGSEQIEQVASKFAVTDLARRLDEKTGAFMDTAAVMKSVDLIITSDTATAHLAGGLGVPVWVALPYVPDWRWLQNRQDSPWYPTMRLFRQSAPSDWDGVFTDMAKALAQLTGQKPEHATISIDIAPGELIDKITILEIKCARISDPQKLANVTRELAMLSAARQRSIPTSSTLETLTGELKKINGTLWDIEDAIRVCERKQDFGATFIELARAVYGNNDERASLKRQINVLLGSKLIEEKSYA